MSAPSSGAAPAAGISLRRYVDVVRTLAAREFVGRYRGNLMGTINAVLIPLLFLATYTFVFSTLIPIRLPRATGTGDYAFFLLAGLLTWNLFAEPVGRSPRAFSGAPHFVRTALFPSSALVVASCVASLYQALVWLAVFAAATAAARGTVAPTLLLAPLGLLAALGLAAGLSLLIASLGVFVRDLGELVAPALTLAMFVSPVLYPAESIERVAPAMLAWNPAAPAVQIVRGLVLDGVLPAPGLVLTAGAWALAALAVGGLAYLRIRRWLGDVV